MSTAAVIFAPGFEEIEAITIVDVLRRAEIEVTMAGLAGDRVTGAHGIEVSVDTQVVDLDAAELDAVILPGGMPGADHLSHNSKVKALVQAMDEAEKTVAAICAAPWALQEYGILEGRKVTCYPSFAEKIPDAEVTDERVTVDGTLITGQGPGPAMDFALTVAAALVGADAADKVREAMLAN